MVFLKHRRSLQEKLKYKNKKNRKVNITKEVV